MKTTLALVVLLLLIPPPPGGWSQSSFPGIPFQLTSAVAVCPTANGCWTYTNTFQGNQTNLPVGNISSVIPNRYPNQWATITDVSVSIQAWHPGKWGHERSVDSGTVFVDYHPIPWNLYSTPFPSCLVIRDGNTGKVLFAGPLNIGYVKSDQYRSLLSFAPFPYNDEYTITYERANLSLSCHLATPIVLDYSGPATPTFEVCPVDPDSHYSLGSSGAFYFGGGSMQDNMGWNPLTWQDGLSGTISVQGRYVYNT